MSFIPSFRLLLPGWLLFVSTVCAAPEVFVLGDMEKPTGGQNVVSSPDCFHNGVITLHGAGNEVVAFQLLLQVFQTEADLDVRVSDLVSTGSVPGVIPSDPDIRLFLAHYVRAKDAGYGWGEGGAGVLSWRGMEYPDALIPFHDPYGEGHEAVAVPFTLTPAKRRNQLVWVDVFIPKNTPAGVYHGRLEVLQRGEPLFSPPVRLVVHPFSLPDESHVDAFGELYRETGVMFDSAAKFKLDPDKDWPVYSRYLQMAHAHRFLAVHRAENGPLPTRADGKPADGARDLWTGWEQYSPWVGQVLDGSLFTAGRGYVGPSAGTGPSFYPAPFMEVFYGAGGLKEHLAKNKGELDPALVDAWTRNAAAFWKEAVARGWDKVRFFGYVMDEVDGVQDKGDAAGVASDQVIAFHRAMQRIQAAFDAGTGGTRRIHLLWTSHADAAKWKDTLADLRHVISWWVPNGHALNLDFYRDIAADPEQTVWFYHSGHPAVGNHTINQLGVDLRLWGLLCRRYGIGGSFWWSMMSFPFGWDEQRFCPYDYPVYKREENRWGNGVLFYPGMRLVQAGYRRDIAGPVSSMRMKAYRRGLQDFEYCRLADQAGRSAEVDRLLTKLIPAGFSAAPTGRVRGLWSQLPADYDALRHQLAGLIGAAPVVAQTPAAAERNVH